MNYDVIIIGQSLSGITAGAMLARKNYRVLSLSGPWSSPPPLRPLPEPTGPVLALLEKLHIADQLSGKKPSEIVGQVIMEEHRLDWHINRAALFNDIRREFDGDADKAKSELNLYFEAGNEIAALLARTPPLFYNGFFGRRKSRKAFERFIPDHLKILEPIEQNSDWATSFNSMLYWGSYLPENLSPVFASAFSSIISAGMANLEDATQRLKEFLRDRISMGKGRAMDNVRINGLAFDGKKLLGATWEGDERFFAGKMIIWGESPLALYDLLPQKLQKKSGFLELAKLEPAGFWVTYRFGIDAGYIPVGMTERLVFPTRGSAPILLQKEREGDVGQDTVFNLSFFIPKLEGDEAKNWNIISARLEDALKLVKGIMPFASLPPVEDKKEEILRSLFPTYPPKSDCPLGLTAYGPFTPLSNLLLSGPGIWPTLGQIGELLLGQQLALICVDRLSKE